MGATLTIKRDGLIFLKGKGLRMKENDIDKLINESHFARESKAGWYGFKISCDLHESGRSNMSAPSKQEYCNRIPKKTTTSIFDGQAFITEKGKPRIGGDLLSCSWRVCPKLKELMKKAMED